MRICFLTDNFPPEVNAPATRTYEHCREWVKLGANVTVITCAPNFPEGKVYEGYKNRRHQEEMMNGIRVIRVWTYIAENKGTVKRTLDYLSFYFSSLWAGRKEKFDILIGTTPQFFTALAAQRLAKRKKLPWIMEVRDIWPESIKAVDAVSDGPIIRYLEKKEMQCYTSASQVVCVTNGICERLKERGIPPEKLKVFTNGANLENYFPREKDKKLQENLKLKNKTVIIYLGTMGLSHRLDFILNCAAAVEDDTLHFLLIGGGAEKENLRNLSKTLHLTNTTILDPIEKEKVPNYLSLADIALVNLKKTDLFLGALPSKIFENAAMGKPILLGLQGEAEKVINQFGAGLAFEPENQFDFLGKLNKLVRDREFYNNCVEGSLKLAASYDRTTIAENMYKLIVNIAGE